MNNENKDYILNIRISKKTYEKVKDLAKENAQSVSHLVRKVINDGLDIASDLSEDIFGKGKKETNIISYYHGIAGRDIWCAKCGRKIKMGQKIVIGESTFEKKYYFCVNCK